MYVPAGFWKDGLGDIDVIAQGDDLHAFYLSIPSHDRVGHLTSRDGLTWAEQKAAIHTGDPGDFDDDQIWTMGVFEHAGRFFMLYTGLAMKEQGKVQRVGLATSDDLFTWTKAGANPVLCADPRWYEAEPDATHRVDWRDPWVYSEGGVLHGVISARSNQGPLHRRGCAGYFVSVDGYDWEVKPPLCVPGVCYDFETPALARLQGRYYLTGICGKNSGAPVPSIVRVADRVEGPYRRIGHDELLPGDNQVFKPCVWRGRTLYFHNLRGQADWDGGAHNAITCLAPPKIADTTEDGALVLRPYLDWDAIAAGPAQKRSAASLYAAGKAVAGQWDVEQGTLQGTAVSGFAALLLEEENESFVLETEIEGTGAGEFGVMLRSLDHADDATFVSLAPRLRRVQLYTLQPYHKTPSAGVTYRWRGRRLVQEWVSPFAWSVPSRLRVVVYGAYCEVSVDERVALSAITMRRPAGRLGFFAEDAAVSVKTTNLQPLRSDDGQARGPRRQVQGLACVVSPR